MKKGMIAVLAAITGVISGTVVMELKRVKDIEEKKELSEKHLRMFKMMNQWLYIKQMGKSLTDYFDENGYKRVIIYGMHYAGERLIEELKASEIEIICGIDKNVQSIFKGVKVIDNVDEIPDADVIVITAITFFDEIVEGLKQKTDCPIVSLENIVYDM